MIPRSVAAALARAPARDFTGAAMNQRNDSITDRASMNNMPGSPRE